MTRKCGFQNYLQKLIYDMTTLHFKGQICRVTRAYRPLRIRLSSHFPFRVPPLRCAALCTSSAVSAAMVTRASPISWPRGCHPLPRPASSPPRRCFGASFYSWRRPPGASRALHGASLPGKPSRRRGKAGSGAVWCGVAWRFASATRPRGKMVSCTVQWPTAGYR